MSGHITQEQADEYAVGSLDTDLERTITLHVAECSGCRRMLEDAQHVAAVLALSAPIHPVPEGLKNRIVTSAGIRRPLWRRALGIGQAAAGIAAVLVAVAAFTGMVSMRSQVADLRQQNAELSVEIEDVASQEVQIFALSKRLSDTEAQAALMATANETNRQLLAAMLNPESSTAEVVRLESAGSSVGRLVWEADRNRLWLYALQLPPLADNQAYQVWAESGGRYTSLGPLVPDESGTATYVRDVPEGIELYASVLVTIETRGGSPSREGAGVFYVANLPRP